MINAEARQFMRSYFKSAQGVKCRVGFMWRYDDKFYPVGYPYHKNGMSGLLERDFLNFKTIHSFNYIWNESVLVTDSWNNVRDSIVGVSPVMDIDSPDDKRGGRLDCLQDNKAIGMFEDVRLLVKDELTEFDEWDGCRMMFSGNGIYFILQDCFCNIESTVDAFLGCCADINTLLKEPIIDSKNVFIPNKFNKIPFTMHYKYNRLAIPLNKDKAIDRDYIIDNCGLDCNVSKVIGDCGW